MKEILTESKAQNPEVRNVKFLSSHSEYAMADEWFEFVRSDHFWIQWRFNRLIKILPTSYEWGQVLDVGCGNAVVQSQVEKYNGRAIDGCDLSIKALREALPSKGELYYYNVHDRRKDLQERYDTIFLLDVLEHIQDPVRFIDSIRFHLKDNGLLIVNVPAFQLFYSSYDEVQGHVKRYRFKLLQEEFNAAGFCIENTMYWGMSMVPIVLLRKLIVNFFPKEKIMSVGFQPQNAFVNFIFQSLRRIECRIFKKVPFGTSLMAVARKVRQK